MKEKLKVLHRALIMSGVNIKKGVGSFKYIPKYIRDLRKIKKQMQNDHEFSDIKIELFPCLADIYDEGGVASGHYFHQDLLVANKVFESNPNRHVDIGSRIDGFVAHVATFRKIKVLDIRQIESEINNIEFVQADLMSSLEESLLESCDSLSCLHALEHFGLGRYGDELDYKGHLKGLENLNRMLCFGGTLYLSVPIGDMRIEFNAHRIFSIEYMLGLFKKKFELRSFSYVDDKGKLHRDVSISDTNISSNFGCRYGCGIFELKKVN